MRYFSKAASENRCRKNNLQHSNNSRIIFIWGAIAEKRQGRKKDCLESASISYI